VEPAACERKRAVEKQGSCQEKRRYPINQFLDGGQVSKSKANGHDNVSGPKDGVSRQARLRMPNTRQEPRDCRHPQEVNQEFFVDAAVKRRREVLRKRRIPG